MFLFGGQPARNHRRDNLQLIVNREHREEREPEPLPWLVKLREDILRQQRLLDIEKRRAEIRDLRAISLRRIQALERVRESANAAIAAERFTLKQLETEDQLLDAPR